MKHGLVYLLLVAGVVLTGSLPFASHDVGELRPVQTALVRMEADRVILKTDMGDVGAGIGWDAAMADLKAKAPGTVFFGTASFLLLEESAQDLLSELPQKMELNPGCALCLAPAEVDLEAASEYFDAHEPGWDLARLRQAQAAGKPVTLPRLVVTEGGICLYNREIEGHSLWAWAAAAISAPAAQFLGPHPGIGRCFWAWQLLESGCAWRLAPSTDGGTGSRWRCFRFCSWLSR